MYCNGSWETLGEIVCNKCNQCMPKSAFKANRYICMACCKTNMCEFNKKKLDGRYAEKQKVYNTKYEASEGGIQRRREYRQKLKDLRESEGRVRRPNPDNRLRTAYHQQVASMLQVPVKMGAALQYLGTSFPIFKKWIEFNLGEDMTWDTMGQLWRLDNVAAAGAGALNLEASKYDAFNWRNWSPVIYNNKGDIDVHLDLRTRAMAFLASIAS